MARSFVKWTDLHADLDRGAERLSEPALALLVRQMLLPIASTSSRARIASQKTAAGGRWRQLKESTQRVRRSLGLPGISGHYPINKRTGALEQFLSSASGDVTILSEYVQGAWPANISMDGTRLMYAYHTAQAGSKRWKTPARPIVALSPTDIAVLGQMTQLYVEQVFESASQAVQAMDARVFG